MVSPGNFAAVDLGSNTFHLVIFRDGGSEPQIIFKMRKAVGIGKKGLERKKITKKALQRGLEALSEFKKYIDEHSCKRVEITATSAFRTAENKEEVLQEIKAKTGFEIKVISGEQEANLIFEGVKRAVHLTHENALIMDIGGGSVEFIICNQQDLVWKQSFEIGGIRLMERFHTTDPLSKDSIIELKNYLFVQLKLLIDACNALKPTYLIGASGTFDTLCDIRNEKVKTDASLHLDLKEFDSIAYEIISRNYEQRLEIPGMIAMRAEMISVACILIELVIEVCSLRYIECSPYALKEGLMFRMLNNEKII